MERLYRLESRRRLVVRVVCGWYRARYLLSTPGFRGRMNQEAACLLATVIQLTSFVF